MTRPPGDDRVARDSKTVACRSRPSSAAEAELVLDEIVHQAKTGRYGDGASALHDALVEYMWALEYSDCTAELVAKLEHEASYFHRFEPRTSRAWPNFPDDPGDLGRAAFAFHIARWFLHECEGPRADGLDTRPAHSTLRSFFDYGVRTQGWAVADVESQWVGRFFREVFDHLHARASTALRAMSTVNFEAATTSEAVAEQSSEPADGPRDQPIATEHTFVYRERRNGDIEITYRGETHTLKGTKQLKYLMESVRAAGAVPDVVGAYTSITRGDVVAQGSIYRQDEYDADSVAAMEREMIRLQEQYEACAAIGSARAEQLDTEITRIEEELRRVTSRRRRVRTDEGQKAHESFRNGIKGAIGQIRASDRALGQLADHLKRSIAGSPSFVYAPTDEVRFVPAR